MTPPDHPALRQIEQGLRAEDPRFAAKLRAGHAAQARRWRLILVLTDVTVLLMLVVGLVSGGVALKLWGLLGLAGVGCVHWLRRKDPVTER